MNSLSVRECCARVKKKNNFFIRWFKIFETNLSNNLLNMDKSKHFFKAVIIKNLV